MSYHVSVARSLERSEFHRAADCPKYLALLISIFLSVSVSADLLLAGRFVNVSGIRKTAIPQH